MGGVQEWFDYDWGFHASEELLSFFMQYSMTDFYDNVPVLSSIENFPLLLTMDNYALDNYKIQQQMLVNW